MRHVSIVLLWAVLIGLASASASPAAAAGESTTSLNPTCPDARLWEGLIDKISWNTLFPIRIAGAKLGGGDVPDGAATPTPGCICQDNNGVPRFGTQVSLWEPARILEVTRVPGCMPSLGGIMLDSNPLMIGGPVSTRNDSSDTVTYSVNYYAFPLLIMLDLFDIVSCKADGYMDMDVINISMVDPTWQDDQLAFLYVPESAIFSLPPAKALCPIDAVSASAGHPITQFSWCAGEWGDLYPLTGNILTNASPPRDSSLAATRMLAKQHRLGMAHKTMGTDAMCKSRIFPTIPKTQYRMAMFFPVAEVEGSKEFSAADTRALKGSHVIGESTYLWGEWRNRPATGEDFVYVLWRWIDCCSLKAD